MIEQDTSREAVERKANALDALRLEGVQEQAREAADMLRALLAQREAADAESAKLRARLLGALSLVPGEATLGELRAAADEARALLARAEAAEAERDEFFNMLGRVTEALGLPVDVTAGRILEAIRDGQDDVREACASVQVAVVVPEGAAEWSPLEAWEEALVACSEAFRDAIRALPLPEPPEPPR